MDDCDSDNLKLDNWKAIRSIYAKSNLEPNEKYVAITILIHRNSYSFRCCPSIKKLVELTGLNKNTVKKHIRQLRGKNIFHQLSIVTGKRRDYTQYFFLNDIDRQIEIANDFNSPINSCEYYQDRDNFEYFIKVYNA